MSDPIRDALRLQRDGDGWIINDRLRTPRRGLDDGFVDRSPYDWIETLRFHAHPTVPPDVSKNDWASFVVGE